MTMARSLQASVEGIEKAKDVFKQKGCTQRYFALDCECTRQTIGKFFARKSIDKTIFKNICNKLNLEYKEIANWELQEEQIRPTINSKLETLGKEPQISTSTVMNASVPQDSITREAIFVLTGTIKLVDKAKLKAIEEHLRQMTGNVTLTITNVEEGSIKITLEGSSEGIEKLASLFKSGQLTEVLEFPVENVEVLRTQEEEEEKSHLIEEIRTQGAKERDLTGADLSGADLRGVDLSGADLFCVDFNGANLSDANLSGANLSGADLSGADLSGADLSGTDLSSADLSGTNLSGTDLSGGDLSDADLQTATVENARFGFNVALSQDMKVDLEEQGVIFENPPKVKDMPYAMTWLIVGLVDNAVTFWNSIKEWATHIARSLLNGIDWLVEVLSDGIVSLIKEGSKYYKEIVFYSLNIMTRDISRRMFKEEIKKYEIPQNIREKINNDKEIRMLKLRN
jgi:acylphosphatase/transcriptional regulator with XRE-family HTH domain